MFKLNFLLRLGFTNLIFLISFNCHAFHFNQHIYALDCNQRSTAVGWFQITDGKIEKISFQNGIFSAHVSSSNFSVGSSLGSLLANYGSYTELYKFENNQAQVAFRHTSPDNYIVNNRKIVSTGADVPILFKCPNNSVAYSMISDDANKRFQKSIPQTAQTNVPQKQYQAPLQNTGPTPIENYVTALKSWQRKYCVSSHLGNLSVPIKEKIGEKFKTNPSKVDFKRFNLSFDECFITVYTDKGPLTCQFLFDKEGNGVLNPCPFSDSVGVEYANQRFNNIGISWAMSKGIGDILNGNTKFKDPFEGTGRGKSLF